MLQVVKALAGLIMAEQADTTVTRSVVVNFN